MKYINLKSLMIFGLLALTFTTGFTCSKNEPVEEKVEVKDANKTQEQMAAPAEVPAAPETPPEGAAITPPAAPGEDGNTQEVPPATSPEASAPAAPAEK